MKLEKFIKEHISTLEHFIESNGYPLRISNKNHYLDEKAAIKLARTIPALAINGDMLERDLSHEFDSDLLAEFWKFKFKEAEAEANKLYEIIQDASRKADS